eukprot:2758952-Alexandrium_andersonii.AAC.1
MEVFEAPGAPCWARPAALFPAEPTFWTLMGCGAGLANPFLEVVLRLRAVQGLLTGPADMRGGSVRDLLKTLRVLRAHIIAGGPLRQGDLPLTWCPGLFWDPTSGGWEQRTEGPPRRRLVAGYLEAPHK